MSKWSSWRVRCRRVWSPSPTPISPCWGRLAGLAAFCAVCRRTLRADDGRAAACVRSKALRNGCTRSYLVLFNFLFLMGGGAVLSLGFWMHIDPQTTIYIDLLHTVPTSGLLALFEKLPALFILLGGSVAILSFLGCCGACVDSACFISLYILLLCFLLITEVVVTSVVTIFRERILLKLEQALRHQIRHEYNKTGRHSNVTNIKADHVTIVLDLIQVKMNCCGASGPDDYRNSAWFNRSRPVEEVFVPSSCCVSAGQPSNRRRDALLLLPRPSESHDRDSCQLNAILFPNNDQSSRSLRTQGCRKSMVDWFNSNLALIVGVVFFVVLTQIFDVVSACALLGMVRQKHIDSDDDECTVTADFG